MFGLLTVRLLGHEFFLAWDCVGTSAWAVVARDELGTEWKAGKFYAVLSRMKR